MEPGLGSAPSSAMPSARLWPTWWSATTAPSRTWSGRSTSCGNSCGPGWTDGRGGGVLRRGRDPPLSASVVRRAVHRGPPDGGIPGRSSPGSGGGFRVVTRAERLPDVRGSPAVVHVAGAVPSHVGPPVPLLHHRAGDHRGPRSAGGLALPEVPRRGHVPPPSRRAPGASTPPRDRLDDRPDLELRGLAGAAPRGPLG